MSDIMVWDNVLMLYTKYPEALISSNLENYYEKWPNQFACLPGIKSQNMMVNSIFFIVTFAHFRQKSHFRILGTPLLV